MLYTETASLAPLRLALPLHLGRVTPRAAVQQLAIEGHMSAQPRPQHIDLGLATELQRLVKQPGLPQDLPIRSSLSPLRHHQRRAVTSNSCLVGDFLWLPAGEVGDCGHGWHHRHIL